MKFHRYFTIIYWSIFLAVMLVICINNGLEVLKKCEKVNGLVVDQLVIYERKGFRGGSYVPRPQISYPVGDTEYLYVDHNVSLNIGEKPTVLYFKDDPHTAQVYNFSFWIDLAVMIPSFLLCLFVYKVVIIMTTRYQQKSEILPSNL